MLFFIIMIKTTTLSAEYFLRISQALEDAGIFRPTLVIDKARLDENLKHLMDVIQQGFDYRIVAKSLPSIPLLEYIMERSKWGEAAALAGDIQKLSLIHI